MKRTLQLFTLVVALFTLLSAAHPAAAQSPATPCAAGAVSPDCVRFRAYLQRHTQTWQDATIPESTMGAIVRRYIPNWDANDVAYIPESTMVVPLEELFGAELAEIEGE